MTPAKYERLLRAHTTIDLLVETMLCPDLEPAVAEEPLHFSLRIAGGTCTTYSPTQRGFTPIDETTHDRLVTLASSALAEGCIGPEVDTALSRTMTTLLLRVDDGMAPPRSVRAVMNHLGPRDALGEVGWSAVLCALGDVFAPRGEDLARWSRVLSFFRTTLRMPTLSERKVTALGPGAHAWALPLLGRWIYLRLGQPPGDSPLFVIAATSDGAEVRSVEADGREAPVALLSMHGHHATQWSVSGGSTSYRESPSTEVEVSLVDHHRVTIRAGAQGRGVFLQSGEVVASSRK